MKKSMFFIGILITIFCNGRAEIKIKNTPENNIADSITPWTKPYAQEYILQMKEYVEIVNNRLVFNLTQKQAVDSLKIPEQAYTDLYLNIKQVNEILDSSKLDLPLPLKQNFKYMKFHIQDKTAVIDTIVSDTISLR